jgi:DNA-binding response OmpR family regulator
MARILIVEDDRASVRLLELLLKKGGNEVTSTQTLEGAREWLREFPEFDLMILDNRLGDNFGWELLGELRANVFFHDFPVVVYTAAGDRDSVAKYVQLRAQNIRAKPYAPDVLADETAKAVKSAWCFRNIEPAEAVAGRLQISPAEYFAGMREFARKLESTADALLEVLSPAKERQFLLMLNELRSQAVNFGVPVVSRIIKECVLAFRDEEWSQAVKAVRTLNLVARSIVERARVPEAECVLPPEAAKAEVGSDPVFRAGPSAAEHPEGKVSALSHLMAAEVPAIFREMAAALADRESLQQLVRRCLVGNVPSSPFAVHLEYLGQQLSSFAFLEPGDLDPVVAAVGEVPGLEATLRESAGGSVPEGASPRELVAVVGVFQVGLIAATLKVRKRLADAGFPLRMEFVLARQLLMAQLVRTVAARIQRPVNLEAVVWLQFLGEWIFAIRFPGVYGLMLLNPRECPLTDYGAAFSTVRRSLLDRLDLPPFCRESLDAKLETFSATGASRLAVGLCALSEAVIHGANPALAGYGYEAMRESFIDSPGWGLLAKEQLKLPADRERFFEKLVAIVPELQHRAENILGRGPRPVASPSASA